jgi:Kef-type K+ transport system membrane component KefB
MLILLAFVTVALVIGVLTIKARRSMVRSLERTLTASSQLAVRWMVVLLFGLALLAYRLGLHLLLGGLPRGDRAGAVARSDAAGFDSKLSAPAFGVFVPFFFIVSA